VYYSGIAAGLVLMVWEVKGFVCLQELVLCAIVGDVFDGFIVGGGNNPMVIAQYAVYDEAPKFHATAFTLSPLLHAPVTCF